MKNPPEEEDFQLTKNTLKRFVLKMGI